MLINTRLANPSCVDESVERIVISENMTLNLKSIQLKIDISTLESLVFIGNGSSHRVKKDSDIMIV